MLRQKCHYITICKLFLLQDLQVNVEFAVVIWERCGY